MKIPISWYTCNFRIDDYRNVDVTWTDEVFLSTRKKKKSKAAIVTRSRVLRKKVFARNHDIDDRTDKTRDWRRRVEIGGRSYQRFGQFISALERGYSLQEGRKR